MTLTQPLTRTANGIAIDTYTQAPIQLIYDVQLYAPLEEVFEWVATPENSPQWLPGVSSIEMDHREAKKTDILSEGSVRHLHLGTKRQTECLLLWNPPHHIAYRRVDPRWADHFSLITLAPDGAGGVHLTWRQYYRSSFSIGAWLSTYTLGKRMQRALKNLQKRFPYPKEIEMPAP